MILTVSTGASAVVLFVLFLVWMFRAVNSIVHIRMLNLVQVSVWPPLGKKSAHSTDASVAGFNFVFSPPGYFG